MPKFSTVNDWIRHYQHTNVKFFPTAISKETGIPLKEVQVQLDKLCIQGKLNPIYNLVCLDCQATLEKHVNPNILPVDKFCPFCGEERTIEFIDELEKRYEFVL